MEEFHTHGFAEIASRTPITERTVFRIASITKTFTAIAVMQLWEQGAIDLDGRVADYLRSYRLVGADPAWCPATVRHLLTHTAGLPELARPVGVFAPDFGESVPAGEPLPSPAEFYRGEIRLGAEPGTRFVYNNHGPTTLGQMVADVTGTPLRQFFLQNIFEPLGMENSDLVRSDRVTAGLATGYEIRSGGVSRVGERDMITAGAASIYSTAVDMARYLAALMGGGANRHGSVLKPETLASMFEPHFRPDPRVPGMGLGFFRSRVGERIVVGHQGTHPGFHSQILLDPEAGAGVMMFTNGARQADFWLPTEAAGMLGDLIGAPPDHEPGGGVPLRPELWHDLCGWYRLDAGMTDIRLRGMMGAGAEVFVRGGRLLVRFLSPIPAVAKGFPLIPISPDDPDRFAIDLGDPDLEPMHIVFGRDVAGTIVRIHFEAMPLTMEKQPAPTNPRRWVAAGGVLAAAAAVATWRRAG